MTEFSSGVVSWAGPEDNTPQWMKDIVDCVKLIVREKEPNYQPFIHSLLNLPYNYQFLGEDLEQVDNEDSFQRLLSHSYTVCMTYHPNVKKPLQKEIFRRHLLYGHLRRVQAPDSLIVAHIADLRLRDNDDSLLFRHQGTKERTCPIFANNQ